MQSKTPCFYELRLERSSHVEHPLIFTVATWQSPCVAQCAQLAQKETPPKNAKNAKNLFPRTLSARGLEEGKTTGCDFFSARPPEVPPEGLDPRNFLNGVCQTRRSSTWDNLATKIYIGNSTSGGVIVVNEISPDGAGGHPDDGDSDSLNLGAFIQSSKSHPER